MLSSCPDWITLHPVERKRDQDEPEPLPRKKVKASVVDRTWMSRRGTFLIKTHEDPGGGMVTDSRITWHMVAGDPSRDLTFTVKSAPVVNRLGSDEIWEIECDLVS